MNAFQIARRRRQLARLPKPEGWGVDQLEQRAAKSAAAMRKFDAMPKEYRLLAHEYGMTAVRVRMKVGATPEQIRRELT